MRKTAAILTAAAALLAAVTCAAPASADASGPYVFVNAFDHMCMDVAGGSTAQGAAVVQNDCTGAESEKWQKIYIATGDANNATTLYYELKNVHSQLCLDLPWGDPTAGVLLQQMPCWGAWGGNMQLWAVETVSTANPVASHLKNRMSGGCVDDKDWSPYLGSNLQQWYCWNGDVQLWRLY